MSLRRLVLVVVGALLAALVYKGFFSTPPGPRSLRVFDPDRVADLEVDMWQAYYAHERVRLFRDLVTSLHEQYRYPWAKAAGVAFHLARAAATFADLRSNYEQVLPDLERAYAVAKDWTHANFDPAAVARAELAWWIARRVPGRDSPEQVGALIADENAILYEIPRERVLEASTLRARAGKLRDEGGEQADWATVSQLLHESYRQLHRAFQ
jgi:hypothetical protein